MIPTRFVPPRQRKLQFLAAGCLGILALFVSALSAQAQFPLPFYEPFPTSYTNTSDETVQVPQGGTSMRGRRLGAGDTVTVWSFGGSTGGGSSVVVGGDAEMKYLNLATNPEPTLGLYIRTNNTTANRDRAFLYTTTSSGKLYTSFLLKVEQPPSVSDPFGPNRLFAKLDNSTTGNGQTTPGAGVWVTSDNTLAISKNSNTAPTADTGVNLGTGIHLIVLRYTWNPDLDDDEVAVWIDPVDLAVAEGSIPAPTLTVTAGGDIASLSSFFIYHVGSEVVASLFMDEIRVGTSWAEVTPTGTVCTPAAIVTSPASQSLAEGLSATLSVIASGTQPQFTWETSTDNGSTWNAVPGATASSYRTPVLDLANDGDQYRAIVAAACGGASVTSEVATVTVQAATPTANGLIMDDDFSDGSRFNIPFATNNSIWVATAGLDVGTHLLGTPQSGSAVWMGYFTDVTAPPAPPVHLSVGQQMKSTLAFSASSIVANGGNSMRFGIFDYADGGTQSLTDGSAVSGSGVGVRGYMLVLNWGTTFDVDTPLAIYARNNLGAADLMGTTGNYDGFGSGPTGATLSGTPAFTSDTTNIVEIAVQRIAADTVVVSVAATNGAGQGWSHSFTDSTYAYPRFDTYAIRPNSAATTAALFTFYQFKVEVSEVAVPVNPFEITESVLLSPSSLKISWESVSGRSYEVQSTTSLSSPVWTTDATIEATGSSTSYTNSSLSGDHKFYRVMAQP